MTDIISKKRKVLITGATSGIGYGITVKLNQGDSKLFITGRNDKVLNQLNSISMKSNFISAIKADLCNLSDIDYLVNNLDVLDGIILNAGILDYTPTKLISEKKINKIFNTNVFSNILLIQKLLSQKKIAKSASIIFISSVAAQTAVSGTSLYAASKGAINSFARVLASELSGQKIRVNVISPGIVKTDLISKQNILTDNQFEEISEKYPLGIGNVSNVVDLVEFLLSENSKWITGANINIDGGYLLNN